MCEPASLIALASLTVAGVSAGLGYVGQVQAANAQNQAAAQNAQSAEDAYRFKQQQLNTQLQQQRDQIIQADTLQVIDAERLRASARVSAAEAGVSGVSLDAIISQTDRERAMQSAVNGRNFQIAQMDTVSAGRDAFYEKQNRVNAVPRGLFPNMLSPILQTAGAGLNMAASLYQPRLKPAPVTRK